MRICRLFCLMLCFVMILGMTPGAFASEEDRSVDDGCRGVDAAVALGGQEQMLETTKAAVVYERNTGTLIYGYNLDERIYPSSMVKLMTAMVALRHGNLDEAVTVTRTALESMGIGVVSANLVRGEEISLRDLLYCLMVASANDAATVIAEHIGGSQGGFVDMMNELAREIGLTGTNFSNAHGLHDEDNYTTVRDVMKVIETGLEDPEFKAMFEAYTYTVPATNKTDARVLYSTNKMMDPESKKYHDDRVTGGKTGATDEAGRCLAVSAKVGDMELIAVVMGAKATYSSDGSYLTRYGSFEEMEELLDFAQKGFECRQLFYADQVVAQYEIQNGECNVVTTPADEAYCVVPKGITAQDLIWKYAQTLTDVKAPIAKGQAVTTMEVWYGNICLAQTELIAMNEVAVNAPLSEDRITEHEKVEEAHGEVLAMIFGVVLGIAVVGVGGFFLVRWIQMTMIKARVRRRRRNRRRNRNARME